MSENSMVSEEKVVLTDEERNVLMGLCLLPLICKWIGGIDDEMADYVSDDVIDSMFEAFDPLTKEDKDFFQESIADMNVLKDAIRNVMLKFKDESDGVFSDKQEG